MHGLRRRNFRIALALFALPLTAFPRIASAGSVVQTEQVRAELRRARTRRHRPGQDRLARASSSTHIPHWHTYWINPGDSGLAPQP